MYIKLLAAHLFFWGFDGAIYNGPFFIVSEERKKAEGRGATAVELGINKCKNRTRNSPK